MSFLNYGSLELIKDAAAIKKLIDTVLAKTEAGDSPSDTLVKVLKGQIASQVKEELLDALKEFVNENGNESLEGLFEKLKTISERKEEADRQIGWPSEEWSKKVNKKASEKEYGFSLDVKGGVSFEIDEAKPTGNAVGSSLLFSGSLGGSGSGKFTLPNGGLNASVEADVSRSLRYRFSHNENSDYTGIAMGQAFALLPVPSKAETVLDALEGTVSLTLTELLIMGSGGFGGKAGLDLKFPTQYGTPGIKLGGELRFSNNYTCSVKSHTEKSALAVTYENSNEHSRGFEAGISYSVGLSTILPNEARKLLAGATEAHKILVDLDKYVNDLPDDLSELVFSWLKPGDLIKAEIGKEVEGVLKKLKEKHGSDLTLVGGIARFVGIDKSISSNLNTNEVESYLTEQLTKLTTDILDEHLDTFGISSSKLASDLVGAFKGTLDKEILDLLDTKVFSKVKSILDAKIKSLAKHVDNEAKELIDLIDEQVGGATRGTLGKLKVFITSARTLSKAILDGVTRAQTDLLAAELGYQYASSREGKLEYTAIFDTKEEQAKAAYRNAIVKPRAFAQTLLSPSDRPRGVTLPSATAYHRLTATKGHRWSVAFVGIPAGYERTKLKDMMLKETPDGVLFTNSQTVKVKSKFWNETRVASFISAVNALQAKGENPLPGGGADVGAALKLGICFTENDGSASASEVEKLLKNFVKAKLVSSSISKAIVEDVKKLKKQSKARGERKLKMDFKIGLAVPPGAVIAILDAAGSAGMGLAGGASDGIIRKATTLALAEHDSKRINEAMHESAQMPELADLGLGLDQTESGDRLTFEERVDFLNVLSDTMIEEESLGMRERVSARDLSHRIGTKTREVVTAVGAIERVIELAADLYHNAQIPTRAKHGALFPTKLAEYESFVALRQKEMNDIAAKFLLAGKPWPKLLHFLGAKVPERTVSLYSALQRVVVANQNVTPPLLITLLPENDVPRSYIAIKPGP